MVSCQHNLNQPCRTAKELRVAETFLLPKSKARSFAAAFTWPTFRSLFSYNQKTRVQGKDILLMPKGQRPFSHQVMTKGG